MQVPQSHPPAQTWLASPLSQVPLIHNCELHSTAPSQDLSDGPSRRNYQEQFQAHLGVFAPPPTPHPLQLVINYLKVDDRGLDATKGVKGKG